MPDLSSIRETCTPREDVLQGGLLDKHFAAQLDQVIRNADGYETYSDAESFFSLTYPTAGLQALLAGTFARLSGNADAAPSAQHAVYRYETSFGGGKTHGLIGLWHLAQGARPSNVAEFIDPGLLPEECRIAAVVGDSLDPINGLTTGDVTTYTLWGEIARQLGPEAWDRVAESDQARTSISAEIWLELFGDTPTVIVIDELAQYLRRLVSSGDGSVQRLASATIDMLKLLFQSATTAPAVRVIVTLATGTKAFGVETTELEEQLFDVASQELIDEASDVMERPKGAIGRPAEDEEIGFILRRRLFESVDEKAAAAAAKAYQGLYSELAEREVQVGQATTDPAEFCERIRAAYPFHPALIDCLDKRIGPLPGFQRARGALKMLAESVARLWADKIDLPLINLGDLPLEADQVRAAVTTSVGREELSGPAEADFAAPTSHAWMVDGERWPDRRVATRSCRTVFLHSIAGEPSPGAGPPDLYAGTLRPGDDPDLIDESLAATSQVAWHLVSDGLTWRFQVAPNANRIIASETANITNAQITEELDRRIRQIFPNDGPVKAIHGANSPAGVPDADQLRLVVFSHADLTTIARDASKAPDKVTAIAGYAGAKEHNRTYRNSVVFLVPDGDALDAMRDRVRFELAAERITSDQARMGAFDSEVAAGLRQLADKVKLETRLAICTAYRHLYWPVNDSKNNHLRHHELPPRNQGEVASAQTKVVVEALATNGKLATTPPPTDRLTKATGFERSGEVTTSEVAQVPWRDHSSKLVLNPNMINDAITAGIRNGTWVYYDANAERAYTDATAPPAVRIGSDTWLYTKERAEELGLLRRSTTLVDIVNVLDKRGDNGQIDGASLRGGLEELLDGEPTKKEVQGVLSANAQTGDRIIVVDHPASTQSKALTPAAITRGRLDDFDILTPARAEELGIVGPTPKELAARGEGSVGAAFQQVTDRIADLGSNTITNITVSAVADPGEGPRDIRLLGICIPQLPRFACTVTLKLVATYQGLEGGVKTELEGPASDYQRIEETLLKLVKESADCAGTLTLDLTPPAPIRHGDSDWQQLQQVVTSNDPGAITIIATLSKQS